MDINTIFPRKKALYYIAIILCLIITAAITQDRFPK